ncbi:MAG: ribonuclease N [Bacteroidetes bacterium]|nr:ribonuclease N [Bacteroidota bacterium]
MKNKTGLVLIAIGILIGIIFYHFSSNRQIKANEGVNSQIGNTSIVASKEEPKLTKSDIESPNSDISQKTEENLVINYVKQKHHLPDCYITKSEAKKRGWIPFKGNLCDVVPGFAIGGDHFSNREGTLPEGNTYYEADVNFSCGGREADRIVFTKTGEVWITHNHYKNFEKR